MKKTLKVIIPILLSLLFGILGLGFGVEYYAYLFNNSKSGICTHGGFLSSAGYESCGQGFALVGLFAGAILGILINKKYLKNDIR